MNNFVNRALMVKKNSSFKFKWLLLPLALLTFGSRQVYGTARDTIYNETFGSNSTSSTKTFSSTTDFSNANTWSYMTVDGWNQGKNSVTPSNTVGNTYTGASGNAYAQCSSSSKTLILKFGDISSHSNVVLTFGYRNGAGKSDARSFKTHVSADGGKNWTEIDCNRSRKTQTWEKVTYNVPAASLDDFAIKFSTTANNQSAVDDIILSCDASSCSDPTAPSNSSFLWTAYFIARKPFCRAA